MQYSVYDSQSQKRRCAIAGHKKQNFLLLTLFVETFLKLFFFIYNFLNCSSHIDGLDM